MSLAFRLQFLNFVTNYHTDGNSTRRGVGINKHPFEVTPKYSEERKKHSPATHILFFVVT